MLRRPTLPILFPYTTLFRSLRRGRLDESHAVSVKLLDDSVGLVSTCGVSAAAAMVAHATATISRGPRHSATSRGSSCDHANGDRKSTRLNSSHANISYAVFC